MITLSGKLTDSRTRGHLYHINLLGLSGSGLGNTGAIEAYTQPDGTFSFRTSVPPPTVSNGWTARAEFFGEGNHLGSKSNIITFNTVKRAVDLTVTAKDVLGDCQPHLLLRLLIRREIQFQLSPQAKKFILMALGS